MELLDMGRVEGIMVDVDHSDDVIKLLDAAVIKMEGGDDFDLTVLDEPPPEDKEEGSWSRTNSESQAVEKSSPEEKKKKRKDSKDGKDESKTPEKPLEMTITPEQKELQRKAEEFSKQQREQEETKNHKPEEKKSKKKKRHRDKTEYSYESGTESESGSDSEPEPAPPGVEDDAEPGSAGMEAGNGEKQQAEEKECGEIDDKDDRDEKEVDTTEGKVETGEEKDDENKPKALHKTCSIFLRNLAPTITKQEVEAVCKRYPGFIRVALQDPQPERRFFRRGWVTFERNVNIKEICWNLNNIRLRDCELGATLNRELKQRVRPVNGVTAHKQVVKQDIKVAAKIIQNLDEKWRLWNDDEEEKKDEEKGMILMSRNPILKNITDYLVEEGSFEEEELLGESVDEKTKEGTHEVTLERDENLIKALDRLVLYLRIVHSIDYYSANEYPNEDEMPHRCGIMHGRGTPPTSKITQNDVTEWISTFESKIKQFVEIQESLDNEEAVKLGQKDPEAEVEKFVQSNTQELAKDKWLCPISGKKFKGPEFVRKHIFNKHAEKIEEVKKEVSFFNNYLLDSKRPQLPEHPGSKQGGGDRGQFGSFQGGPQQGMMGYNQPGPPMMYRGRNGPPHFPQQFQRESYRGDNYRRPNYPSRGYSRRSDPRSIIEYRDLDAPDDMDIF